MNRRDFLRLSVGAAGVAAMPSIAMSKMPEPLVALSAPLRSGVEALVRPGGVLSIGGLPKAGKSLLATDLGVLLAGAPGKFLERFPVLERGPVFHLYSGMSESSLDHRLNRIADSRAVPPYAGLPYDNSFASLDLAQNDDIAYLQDALFLMGAKYLIIDPIECYGGHAALLNIAHAFKHLSIIFTYNTNAPTPRSLRGSPVLGVGDTHIHIQKAILGRGDGWETTDGTRLISFETRHIPDPKPMTVRLNPKTLRFKQL